MSKKSKIAIIAGISFLFIIYIGSIVWLAAGSSSVSSGNSIALIKLSGVIASSDDSLFGGGAATPENIISQLRKAEEDEDVKAILLRINSPGGTAGASQEIFSEVKKAKKPVVASISDIGASGAYWVASAADVVIANKVSEVGSIGVIIQIPNLKKLFENIGAEMQTIKQGKYKDLGNSARPLTGEEKKILENHSNQIYQIFVEEVAKSRKLPKNDILKIANGLTYPGVEAKKLKLIDEIGNFSDAIETTGKLGKIKGKPEIIQYDEPGFFDLFTGFSEVNKTLGKLTNSSQINDIIYNRPIPR